MPTDYLYMFHCMYPPKNKYTKLHTYFVKCTAKAFTKNRSADPEQVVLNEGHVSMFLIDQNVPLWARRGCMYS